MTNVKLPIGIQDFEKLILGGYAYIDKTKLIYRLITQGAPYFLSRPRRFGKSLLISTLHALFSGKKELFQGLKIASSDWTWEKYPIIRLDMSKINNQSPDLFEHSLIDALVSIATDHQLTIKGRTPSDYLSSLITQMGLTQKVVVLIDEYDRPLIDQLDCMEIAKKNQEILKRFYSILKAEDYYIKFMLLTGVTKFSKVSIFSGLNNLIDLSMMDQYSSLLGYTREEIETFFPAEVSKLAIKMKLTVEECYAQIKDWYNGYLFSNEGQRVYNPFSLLNLFHSNTFSAYWFETGTPSFLINLIKKREFDPANLEQITVDIESFNTFDIEDLPTLSLLYQTGYITIKSFLPHINAYILGFPNHEVGQSFSKSLLMGLSSSRPECSKLLIEISTNLYNGPWNYSEFFELIQKTFALIPYDLYVKNEKYFHSLFYQTMKFAGFQIGAEIHTNHGRIDAILELKDKIIIFEFKYNQTSQIAMAQIKEKKYFEFYQDRHVPIYLVGVNFNGNQRMIDDWLVEKIEKLVP